MMSVANFADRINLETLYNKDGRFNYEQVKTIAGRVRSGELEITRLTPREEQGRNQGGRRNVKASLIAGAEARTSQTASRRSREERIKSNKQVEKQLEKYARHEGIWFDYEDFRTEYKQIAQGEEAHVFDRPQKLVVRS